MKQQFYPIYPIYLIYIYLQNCYEKTGKLPSKHFWLI